MMIRLSSNVGKEEINCCVDYLLIMYAPGVQCIKYLSFIEALLCIFMYSNCSVNLLQINRISSFYFQKVFTLIRGICIYKFVEEKHSWISS